MLRNRFDNRQPRPRGRRPNFEKKIEAACGKEKQAEKDLNSACQNQEKVKKANIGIGRAYHPYDPESGLKQDADQV